MRLAVLILLASLRCMAQIVPSSDWVVADPCGGQPAWISSTQIVEESGSSSSPCAKNSKTAGLGSTLFDVKTISKAGGSWSAIQTNLTSPLRPGTIDNNCSAGNPASDGTNLAFIVQDDTSGNCTSGSLQTQSPATGIRYNLWACNATSSLSGSNCNMLVQSNTGTGLALGAMLDPHIDGNHIYVSERNPSGVTVTWNTWFVDDVLVNWATNPPSLTSVTRYNPGTWTGSEVTLSCEQYYKATSFQHLNNGNTRIFTQANQVSNYPNPMSPGSCSQIGRQGYTQSGIFYFDLTGAGGSGSNFSQLYPPTTTPNRPNCFTPSPPGSAYTTACYGEFPIVFPRSTHLFMIFTGQLPTPVSIIDKCQALMGSGCQTNFTDERLVMDLGTDTQNPALQGAIVPQTNYQIPGTALNNQFLLGATGPGGIPGGYFGGCGHIEVDVPSAQLVCGFSTNIQNVNSVNADQTVVFQLQYPGSMIFPKTLVTGNTKISGRVTVN